MRMCARARRALLALAFAVAGLFTTPAGVSAQAIVVFRGVAVAVPRPPGEFPWDDVLSRPVGLTSQNPDIRICLESKHLPPTCLPMCPNAEWLENVNDITGYICRHDQTEIVAEPNLSVAVHDIDGDDFQVVWQDILPNPGTCVGKACTFDLPGGPLKVEFQIERIDYRSYTGPLRGTFEPAAPSTPTPAPASPAPTTRAGIPTAPPPATVSEPSFWDQATDAWRRFTAQAADVWRRFTGIFSFADVIDAACLTPRNNIVSWACGYFFGNTVRTFENATASRIACLRGALGTGTARQTAETACQQHSDGSGALEKCLLNYFDTIPSECMFASDMQGR